MVGDTGEAVIAPLKERLISILIKDERAFEALVARLKQAFTRAWSLGHQEAVSRAIRRLEELGPERFSRAAEREILSAFEREVGPQAMVRLLDGPVTVLGEAIWRAGGAEAGRDVGVDYRFGLVDQEALALARRGDIYWVASHWDAFTRQQLSDAVARYFEEGQTYEQLAAAMREAMAGVHEAGMRYWELVADTMATKTREMGRISGYQQAGVRYVQIKARMDERTTPLCRSLHGRLIRLDTVVAQRDKYLAAAARGNLEAAKAAWPMWDATMAFKSAGGCADHAVEKAALPDNVGLPPYHFRCRTITVAWLGEDPGAQQLVFGERMPADARRQVEAVAPETHAARIDAMRGLAREGRLSWSERHLLADLRKGMVCDGAVRLLRHARAEFDLGGDDAEATRAYNAIAQRVVRDGEALARPHRGRMQYAFGSAGERAVAVVDYEEMRLVGLFGHTSEAAFAQAWARGYVARGARIVRGEA